MKLDINDRWTPRQTLRVLDCLEALHQAIWSAQEAALVDLIIEDLRDDNVDVQAPIRAPSPTPPASSDFTDDDIPF